MGRGRPSWSQKEANRERNRKRNKTKRSFSYQFSKENWKLEHKIRAFVKHKRNVPDLIQQEAKLRVEIGRVLNYFW